MGPTGTARRAGRGAARAAALALLALAGGGCAARPHPGEPLTAERLRASDYGEVFGFELGEQVMKGTPPADALVDWLDRSQASWGASTFRREQGEEVRVDLPAGSAAVRAHVLLGDFARWTLRAAVLDAWRDDPQDLEAALGLRLEALVGVAGGQAVVATDRPWVYALLRDSTPDRPRLRALLLVHRAPPGDLLADPVGGPGLVTLDALAARLAAPGEVAEGDLDDWGRALAGCERFDPRVADVRGRVAARRAALEAARREAEGAAAAAVAKAGTTLRVALRAAHDLPARLAALQAVWAHERAQQRGYPLPPGDPDGRREAARLREEAAALAGRGLAATAAGHELAARWAEGAATVTSGALPAPLAGPVARAVGPALAPVAVRGGGADRLRALLARRAPAEGLLGVARAGAAAAPLDVALAEGGGLVERRLTYQRSGLAFDLGSAARWREGLPDLRHERARLEAEVEATRGHTRTVTTVLRRWTDYEYSFDFAFVTKVERTETASRTEVDHALKARHERATLELAQVQAALSGGPPPDHVPVSWPVEVQRFEGQVTLEAALSWARETFTARLEGAALPTYERTDGEKRYWTEVGYDRWRPLAEVEREARDRLLEPVADQAHACSARGAPAALAAHLAGLDAASAAEREAEGAWLRLWCGLPARPGDERAVPPPLREATTAALAR